MKLLLCFAETVSQVCTTPNHAYIKLAVNTSAQIYRVFKTASSTLKRNMPIQALGGLRLCHTWIGIYGWT